MISMSENKRKILGYIFERASRKVAFIASVFLATGSEVATEVKSER